MSNRQKATADIVDTVGEVVTPEVKKIPGFVAKGRLMQYEVPLTPEDGAEPFRFSAYGNLTIAEVEQWNVMLRYGASYEAFWDLLCPRVVAWNAVAFDLASGEYQPVPPPAEGGHDAFRVIDPALTALMAAAIASRVLNPGGPDRPKASRSTPAPSNGSD